MDPDRVIFAPIENI